MRKRRFLASLLWLLLAATIAARAQDNWEIQVYDSELVPANSTMVEIHSNFTVPGSKTVVDGVQPTNQAMHETLEITQGFNDWFENRSLRLRHDPTQRRNGSSILASAGV